MPPGQFSTVAYLHEGAIHLFTHVLHLTKGGANVVVDDVFVTPLEVLTCTPHTLHMSAAHTWQWYAKACRRHVQETHGMHHVWSTCAGWRLLLSWGGRQLRAPMRVPMENCMAAVREMAGEWGCSRARAPLPRPSLRRAASRPWVRRPRCLAMAPKPATGGHTPQVSSQPVLQLPPRLCAVPPTAVALHSSWQQARASQRKAQWMAKRRMLTAGRSCRQQERHARWKPRPTLKP